MKFSSLCVHGGTHESSEGAVNTPIYQSSTFKLKPEDYEKILSGKAREISVYTRYGNPTRRAVEEKLALLEGAEDALCFASGMAAISTTLLTFLVPGDVILTTLDLYGGSSGFVLNFLSRWGVRVKLVDPADTDRIIKHMDDAKVLFFESLSNPLLKMLDIERIAENKTSGQIIIVDNTFFTPYNLKPLNYGADIVIHSASKYLNGHSDLIAGFVAGRKEFMDKIWQNMLLLGGSLEPISAYLLERGMKTLSLRMEKHNSNAYEIAMFLEEHEGVERVIYPGLESYPQRDIATKYLRNGYGGMVTFVVKGGDQAGLDFMKNLELITEATSLGGVESLISMPFNTSHAGLTPEEREDMGILPGMVRLSVGIEDIEDLKDDITRALSKLL